MWNGSNIFLVVRLHGKHVHIHPVRINLDCGVVQLLHCWQSLNVGTVILGLVQWWCQRPVLDLFPHQGYHFGRFVADWCHRLATDAFALGHVLPRRNYYLSLGQHRSALWYVISTMIQPLIDLICRMYLWEQNKKNKQINNEKPN